MSEIDWPAGWERTAPEDRSPGRKFEASLGTTTEDLETEMDRLDVESWRASFGNNHRKSNSLPLYNANPDDPGFVMRWHKDGEDFAVACDQYDSLPANARAVYLWLRETRLRSQRPVQTGDDEFAAARLPPADDEDVLAVGPSGASPEPHEVLDVSPDAPDAVVNGAARAMLKQHHPDTNGGDGNPEMVQRVKDARDAMLGGGDCV